MKRHNMISSLVLGSVVISAAFTQVRAEPATADDPFQLQVIFGAIYDDNVFRLEGPGEGEVLLGTSNLSDWYRFLGLEFEGLIAREDHRFEFIGEVRHQTYDKYGEFDFTAGLFRANWHWKVSDKTRGDLGYRYRREPRSFANQEIPRLDIITENALFAVVERKIEQRWLLRFGVETADLQFSASPLLGKNRSGLEAEALFAASQHSTFGLLTTLEKSTFDEGPARDFSGWSVGPSIRWQPRPKLAVTANVSYTHQALEEPQPDIPDFDGIVGFIATDWQPNLSVRWRLRVFRDITDLGGEIPLYTIRDGVSLQPSWQITEKLASRVELGYETREFVISSLIGPGREDRYSLAELWFDLSLARRWIVSFGLGSERRSSNLDAANFDDFAVHATITFDL